MCAMECAQMLRCILSWMLRNFENCVCQLAAAPLAFLRASAWSSHPLVSAIHHSMEYVILFPAAEHYNQEAVMFVACCGVILAALVLFGWAVWSSTHDAAVVPRLVYQVSFYL